MPYWTEKDDKLSTVYEFFDDVQIKIGTIEKPYDNEEYYFCSGWNHEQLYNKGNLTFNSFEDAEKRIVEHYRNERDVLSE
jgi:hypothetical protein